MKIVIAGAGAMLGKALRERLAKHHEVLALARADLDVGDCDAVRRAVGELRPHWVVSTAAYTDVDGAESEPDAAFRANAVGSRNLAVACRESGCRLVYFSTDYIFDGRATRPYREWDRGAPLNVYGESKWAGELFVRRLCPRHLVVRTSWLYGPGGSHFVDKMLALARSKRLLNVVDDQIGSPTYTLDLARATHRLIDEDRLGTYHVSNAEQCSWYEFARAIFRQAGMDVDLHPVPTSRFPRPARRPAYSGLDNCMLRLEGFQPPRPWKEALADYLESRR